MNSTHRELVILGGGPAGLTAGLYAARARIDHLLIEKGAPGGQVLTTDWVDNYPGFPDGLTGFELSEKMAAHARRFDANIVSAEVASVEFPDSGLKELRFIDGSILTCNTLIICTGARPNKLGVPGETELTGKGVSYCGTCDAPFYRDLHVAVIGGGDTAVEEADYLTRFAKRVTIIHRRSELRATGIIQETAFANEKINYLWNTRVTAIEGEHEVQRLQLIDNRGAISSLDVQGVFVLIGITPNNHILPMDRLDPDQWGFIRTDSETRTVVPGVFAAGDIRSKMMRQVVNACGEGATAVIAAEHYLKNR
ncbi:thioredoxin-disulfide reductase [Desulfofustis glycolicus]|uniref:Thioredoxin reductase n=1 Tax=Desulfofustis glycolicus DSM 9705 TaxID=1121409 RepID=A0A1M5UXS3_9BACT|nr:thioredoxin-disulfide reductase [Desulfofustis glycolicus]MCB2215926.1 thioredoxin-disulfide reductase [Desulfobulbaceae bacterium]SHH67716.1 thioredoxin reductase (NADPH) [Desulfofustis glycolicus DSM 9705]